MADSALMMGSWERQAVKDAKGLAGRGWDILSPTLREALVSRSIVGMILANGLSTDPTMNELQRVARAALTHVNPEGR